MAQQAIVPVKISLTEGDYYTLFSPAWKAHGQTWQAFLGDDDHVFFFNSPGDMLAFLESGAKHDLVEHPGWEAFAAQDAARVVPDDRHYYDIIGVPGYLAQRASHANVTSVSRGFAMAKALGNVCSLTTIGSFFSAHSLLANVDRGADHYSGDTGLGEWSAVGRAIVTNWDKVVDTLDEQVFVPPVTGGEEAAQRITAAEEEARRREEEQQAAKAAAASAVDPYDASVWGTSGIDPVKIVIDGKSVYTLRCYNPTTKRAIFLGKFGEIMTFANPKALTRWLVEHHDHDLAAVATWQDIMDAANGGTLEVQVHPDNTYVFTGLSEDIAAGTNKVDTKQLGAAYEVIADAADWAGDDAVSDVLVAQPEIQEYLGYMLGNESGYTPSAPFTAEQNGWLRLEKTLTGRFSKF